MKLAAICFAPTELGGLSDGFPINMSRLAALPRFSASFSTDLDTFCLNLRSQAHLGEANNSRAPRLSVAASGITKFQLNVFAMRFHLMTPFGGS